MTVLDPIYLDTVAQAIWGADENAHEPTWSDVNPRWRDHYQRLDIAAAVGLRNAGLHIVGAGAIAPRPAPPQFEDVPLPFEEKS